MMSTDALRSALHQERNRILSGREFLVNVRAADDVGQSGCDCITCFVVVNTGIVARYFGSKVGDCGIDRKIVEECLRLCIYRARACRDIGGKSTGCGENRLIERNTSGKSFREEISCESDVLAVFTK